jgi:hypothetical protein
VNVEVSLCIICGPDVPAVLVYSLVLNKSGVRLFCAARGLLVDSLGQVLEVRHVSDGNRGKSGRVTAFWSHVTITSPCV